MNKIFTLFIFLSALFFSCKMQPGSRRNNPSNDKKFSLTLHPETATSYTYSVSNQSQTNLIVNEKEVELVKKYDTDVTYTIDKDSTGNLSIRVKYNNIHIYSKTGDAASDLNGSNAAHSTDPVEQLLGALQAATITARLNKAGQITAVEGYQQIADSIVGSIRSNLAAKSKATEQWKQLVEQNLVKKNIEQLFGIFPDSAVHAGDRWKQVNTQQGDINFREQNSFTVTSIDDGTAEITSEGKIISDSTTTTLMGQQVSADLKGNLQGTYQIAVKTGMLISGSILSKITGTMQLIGQSIPVTIHTSVKIDGHTIADK